MPQFVMIGWDGPEGAARRDKLRSAHLDHVTRLCDAGRIAFAGPIKDQANDKSIGVVIVFEASDIDAARALIDGDPYVIGGVFNVIDVHPFKLVFPPTT